MDRKVPDMDRRKFSKSNNVNLLDSIFRDMN